MTVIDTALHEHLRALKLSGMLQTLDARLAQAHAGDLGHLDFLQVLCHDEITRRDTMSMQRRIRRARFEQQSTLEEFDFHANPKLPAAQIRDLAALRWLHAGESIVLYGPVGVGKSHQPGYLVAEDERLDQHHHGERDQHAGRRSADPTAPTPSGARGPTRLHATSAQPAANPSNWGVPLPRPREVPATAGRDAWRHE